MVKVKELDLPVSLDMEFIGKLTDNCFAQLEKVMRQDFKTRERELVWVGEGEQRRKVVRSETKQLVSGGADRAHELPDMLQFKCFGVIRVGIEGGDDKDEILSFDHRDRILRSWRHEELIVQQKYSRIERAVRNDSNPLELSIKLESASLSYTCQTPLDRDVLLDMLEKIIAGHIPDEASVVFPKCLRHGWAEKKGKLKWAKRYVFLTPYQLIAFRSPSSLVPLNVVDSIHLAEARKYDKTKAVFQLYSAQREFFFRCENDYDCGEWLKSIDSTQRTDKLKEKEKLELNRLRQDIHAPIIRESSSAPIVQRDQQSSKYLAALKLRAVKNNDGNLVLPELDKLPVYGTVYSCGRLTSSRAHVYPLMVEGLAADSIRWISSGPEHVSIVSDEFDVYTWGKGMYGRLGHGNEKDETLPKLCHALVGKGVVQTYCGGTHTAALTHDGLVYMWGAGSEGQLGLGSYRDHSSPMSVEFFNSISIKQVALGHAHSAVLTMAGHVYTWGSNDHGQLGHGGKTDANTPTLVDTLENDTVRYISSGFKHMLAITEDGRLFTWGMGVDGQLGRGHLSGQSKPMQVELLQNIPVLIGSCGKHHSAVVSEGGHVYVWGKPSLVGHDNSKQASWPTHLVTISKPALSVFCGYDHTVIITETCEMYSWGRGGNGRLGHGDEFDCPQPRLVEKFTALAGRRRLHSAHLGNEYTLTLVGCRNSALLPPRAPWSLPGLDEVVDYKVCFGDPNQNNATNNTTNAQMPSTADYDYMYGVRAGDGSGIGDFSGGLADEINSMGPLARPGGMGRHNIQRGGPGAVSGLGAFGVDGGMVAGVDMLGSGPFAQNRTKALDDLVGNTGIFNPLDPSITTISTSTLPVLPGGYAVGGGFVLDRYDAAGNMVMVGDDGNYYSMNGTQLSEDSVLFDSSGRLLDAADGFKSVLQHDRSMQPLVFGSDGVLYDSTGSPYGPSMPRFDSLGCPMVTGVGSDIAPSSSGMGGMGMGMGMGGPGSGMGMGMGMGDMDAPPDLNMGMPSMLPSALPPLVQIDVQGKPLGPGCVQPFDDQGRPILRHPDGYLVDVDGHMLEASDSRFSALGVQLDALNRPLPFGAVPMFDSDANPVLVGMDGNLFSMDGYHVSFDTPLFDAKGAALPESAVICAQSLAPILQACGAMQGLPTHLEVFNGLAPTNPHPGMNLPPSIPPGVGMISLGSDPFGRPLTVANDGNLYSVDGIPMRPLPNTLGVALLAGGSGAGGASPSSSAPASSLPLGMGAGMPGGLGMGGVSMSMGSVPSGMAGISMLSDLSAPATPRVVSQVMQIKNVNPLAGGYHIPAAYGAIKSRTAAPVALEELVTSMVTSSGAANANTNNNNNNNNANAPVELLVTSLTSTSAEAKAADELTERMRQCMIRPGVFQLNLRLENFPEALGFIEIDANATLAEVRSAISKEIPELPDFQFLYRSTPFSATQETIKIASQFLPDVQLRPTRTKPQDDMSQVTEKFRLALKGRKITTKVLRMIEEEEKAKQEQAKFDDVMSKIRAGQFLRKTNVRPKQP
eukprot:c12931_g1_i1.p1 GENE.c12931_g1_i1~~c12931_g1_i1.p1  ORF type:complete len:1559 (-),score=432.66 c12931_g1_i1:355-4953(-)